MADQFALWNGYRVRLGFVHASIMADDSYAQPLAHMCRTGQGGLPRLFKVGAGPPGSVKAVGAAFTEPGKSLVTIEVELGSPGSWAAPGLRVRSLYHSTRKLRVRRA